MNPDPQEVASAAALWKTKLANDAWISKMLAKYDHGGTGKLEGIDPGAEGMPRKGAEEAFLGTVSVGHHGAPSEG